MKFDRTKLLIALARKEMNLSDLAKGTGYSETIVRAWANGKRTPSTKAIGVVSKALNVDVLEIVELD